MRPIQRCNQAVGNDGFPFGGLGFCGCQVTHVVQHFDDDPIYPCEELTRTCEKHTARYEGLGHEVLSLDELR
jgi:hypothetical protein